MTLNSCFSHFTSLKFIIQTKNQLVFDGTMGAQCITRARYLLGYCLHKYNMGGPLLLHCFLLLGVFDTAVQSLALTRTDLT